MITLTYRKRARSYLQQCPRWGRSTRRSSWIGREQTAPKRRIAIFSTNPQRKHCHQRAKDASTNTSTNIDSSMVMLTSASTTLPFRLRVTARRRSPSQDPPTLLPDPQPHFICRLRPANLDPNFTGRCGPVRFHSPLRQPRFAKALVLQP
jgi:hypothetical protein